MAAARTFTISKRDVRRLYGRAYRAQKKDQSEVCGLLFLSGEGNLSLDFVKNSADRSGSFLITVADIDASQARAKEAGLRVGGSFHSHPISEPIPGESDIENAPVHSLMLIYDVCGCRAALWRVVKKGNKKDVQERSLIVAS